mmetsp:Transcript_36663/g.83058  ORF Transcript_36663/g.83058 Transcript_36663/m.83058 type:complete len:86 (+) Transcript_36663:137-394(+)|eukprot:4136001-Amphidinium_carterae.1
MAASVWIHGRTKAKRSIAVSTLQTVIHHGAMWRRAAVVRVQQHQALKQLIGTAVSLPAHRSWCVCLWDQICNLVKMPTGSANYRS